MALSKEDIATMKRIAKEAVNAYAKGPTFNVRGSKITDADVDRISRKNDKRLRGESGIKRQGDTFSLDDPNKVADAGKKGNPHPNGRAGIAGVDSVEAFSITTGGSPSFTNTGTAKRVKLSITVPTTDGLVEEAPNGGVGTMYARDGLDPHSWVDIYYLISFYVSYHTQLAAIATALAGGTTGQVLTKNSNTDYDFSWV